MREQRSIVARGQIVREIVRCLEEEMEFPHDAVQTLQTRVTSRDDIEALALRVRDAWELGLGPLSDVVGLLEVKGVIPVEVHGHSDRLDAFSARVDGRAMVFLSLDKQSASRRRFNAAHELGHLFMHEGCEAGETSVEQEADSFAGALLLPEAPFRAECPPRLSWPALRELKRRWGVSLTALVRRAFDLGIYSEATYRRAHVQYNQYGWRNGEPDEPPMERPTLVQHAVEQLVAAGTSPEQIAQRVHLSVPRLEQAIWPRGRGAAA
jgi:Zn-dependent peptidase ImmA (M78 family)